MVQDIMCIGDCQLSKAHHQKFYRQVTLNNLGVNRDKGWLLRWDAVLCKIVKFVRVRGRLIAQKRRRKEEVRQQLEEAYIFLEEDFWNFVPWGRFPTWSWWSSLKNTFLRGLEFLHSYSGSIKMTWVPNFTSTILSVKSLLIDGSLEEGSSKIKEMFELCYRL